MRASLGLRCVPVSLLAAVWLACASPAGALELRVATWNLEHLDDTNGAGCVGREDGDYAALAERIDALGVDVVAFQEVEERRRGGARLRLRALERGGLRAPDDWEWTFVLRTP